MFPELFTTFLETSFVKKAHRTEGSSRVHLEPLRQHGLGKHRSVDDTPYGGGAGMVLRVDCIARPSKPPKREPGARTGCCSRRRGAVRPGDRERRSSRAPVVTLVCGRYEGFDERVRSLVDEEISLGDFVLAGGEIAAMAVIEAACACSPGVLGNEASIAEESFSDDERRAARVPAVHAARDLSRRWRFRRC